MEFKSIGIIHSPFKSKEACPIQPVFTPDSEGRVEVFEVYAEGLKDIDQFSHLYLLYQFDQAGPVELIRPPFLDDEAHGIFATRHPSRPNGIGLSVVRLIRREGSNLIVKGIDVLDGTPLLDIKPYIPRFDQHDSETEGWMAGKPWRLKPAGRE